MAAKRGGKTQKRGGAKSGLLLVGIGLVVGLGLAAAYLVYGDREQLDAILPQPNAQAEAPATSREREPVAQEPEATPESERPTFDFYTVLPEKEVELPGEPVADPTTKANPANTAQAGASAPETNAVAAPSTTPTTAPAAATPAPSVGLKLQAGAFSTAADAEALRAKLALLGMSARIEVGDSGGRTVHRVRLGPYASAAEREAAQRALAEAGIAATPAR